MSLPQIFLRGYFKPCGRVIHIKTTLLNTSYISVVYLGYFSLIYSAQYFVKLKKTFTRK